MLEKIPSPVGRALRRFRAGYDKIVSERPEFAGVPDAIVLESLAFEDGGAIPARYTADGERLSPPLAWRGALGDAEGAVLIVEDADSPSPDPLVHLLAWDLPPNAGQLSEGLFKSPHHDGLDEVLGRNAYRQAAWLPPDPPSGHGRHLYAFQLFMLDRKLEFDRPPARKSLVEAMARHVLAKGVLTGTYERV